MTPHQSFAFIGFAVVLAATPGPGNALITATGASVGVVRGLPALLGVAVGMALLMFAVALGLGTLILANPAILTAVKWTGAVVLLWLAWKIASARHAAADHPARHLGFASGAAFQWINPKAWLAVTSGAATFLDPGQVGALPQAVTLGLIFGLVTLPCCAVWLVFGAAVQRGLRSERRRRAFSIVMGGLLAASVVIFIV
jgi:threonine/homoserine/homoserine lactone efflux protein